MTARDQIKGHVGLEVANDTQLKEATRRFPDQLRNIENYSGTDFLAEKTGICPCPNARKRG
jgi:hypothetical protein